MNGQYLRKLNVDKFTELCVPYLEKAGLIEKNTDIELVKKIVSLEQPRVKKLKDIIEADSGILVDFIICFNNAVLNIFVECSKVSLFSFTIKSS